MMLLLHQFGLVANQTVVKSVPTLSLDVDVGATIRVRGGSSLKSRGFTRAGLWCNVVSSRTNHSGTRGLSAYNSARVNAATCS